MVKKRYSTYYTDFTIKGQRVHENTETPDKIRSLVQADSLLKEVQ